MVADLPESTLQAIILGRNKFPPAFSAPRAEQSVRARMAERLPNVAHTLRRIPPEYLFDCPGFRRFHQDGKDVSLNCRRELLLLLNLPVDCEFEFCYLTSLT